MSPRLSASPLEAVLPCDLTAASCARRLAPRRVRVEVGDDSSR